jgi:lambda repressor-like predicted transcriptional regulator
MRPRYCTRARKLTCEQEAKIRSLSATKSLRALAVEFGVSHETIRTVLGRELPAMSKMP